MQMQNNDKLQAHIHSGLCFILQ